MGMHFTSFDWANREVESSWTASGKMRRENKERKNWILNDLEINCSDRKNKQKMQ